MLHKTGAPTSTAEAFNAFTKCAEEPLFCRHWQSGTAQLSRHPFHPNPASQRLAEFEVAQCMIRRVNAREKFRMKEGLRQCMRPLGGECSPGLDEIRRVPVLRKRTAS
jgi:hypothetical protein